MRGSLWFRLLGAFLVVIVAGAVATYAVVNLVTATQFRRFVLAEDVSQAQALAAPLASYYARQRSWQGVEELLTFPRMAGVVQPGPGMMRGAMSARSMQEMMAAMRSVAQPANRVVLLDANGTAVIDTAAAVVGETHPAEHLERGVPVLANDQQVGTVLVGSMIEPTLNPLGQDFLRSMNISVLAIAFLGGLAALGLGSLLVHQITAPLGKVTAAAEAVAAGELSQRVEEEGSQETRRLARSFNRMAFHLAQAESLRRQMIADVAHELRTPLFVMQGNLEAMLDGVFEFNRENLATVHQETLLLGRLVSDLQDLARAEAGELRLEWSPTDLNLVVRQVVEQLRIEAEDKGVELGTDLASSLPQVEADAQRIEQVLFNLLTNAIRHTPSTARVTIKTMSIAEGVEVAVADEGQGIAAEDLPYIFERFYRADRSRTRVTGGSGLGLTIARQIVEAHGGRIWAECEGPAQGSTFHFTLPYGPPQLMESTQGSSLDRLVPDR